MNLINKLFSVKKAHYIGLKATHSQVQKFLGPNYFSPFYTFFIYKQFVYQSSRPHPACTAFNQMSFCFSFYDFGNS